MKWQDVEKTINNVFNQGEAKGIVEKSRGSYQECVERMAKWIHGYAKEVGDERLANPKHWKGHVVDKYFEQNIERWEKGEYSASSLQKDVFAIEKFRVCVKETGALGKGVEVRVGLKGSVESGEGRLAQLSKHGVVSEGTGRKATPAECKTVQNGIAASASPNAKTASDVNTLQQLTGGRVTAALGLKVGDIDFKNNTIAFEKDKNGFSRTVPLSPVAVAFLKPLVTGKSAGSPVFTIQRSNGSDANKVQGAKAVQTLTKNAADKAGVGNSQSRFTPHSNRRCYAQTEYNATKSLSYSQLKKNIYNQVGLQGSNKPIVMQRIENELYRINYYRREEGLKPKDFSTEQLRRLYVSLLLGHSRLDVVLHYINPDKK